MTSSPVEPPFNSTPRSSYYAIDVRTGRRADRPLAMWPAPDASPALVAMLAARRAYYIALEAEQTYRKWADRRLAELRARREEAQAEEHRAYDALKREMGRG